MEIQKLLSHARDTMTVKRVFGDPIERDGVTVIPVANVRGGAGFGVSDEAGPTAPEAGGGGGYGVAASPAGVFIIRGDQVDWEPATNVNLIVIGGQLVLVAVVLAVRAVLLRRHEDNA